MEAFLGFCEGEDYDADCNEVVCVQMCVCVCGRNWGKGVCIWVCVGKDEGRVCVFWESFMGLC